ncbi:MAG: MlaD family protein [bacterium]
MKFLNKEEKVGLMVIMALISLTYLTFKAGKLSLGRDRGLVLYADFKSVHGLEKGAQVKVSGVEAGRVEDIRLIDGNPRLTLVIFPGIRIRADAVAEIQSQGFMGEKHVELDPGSPGIPYLESGSQLKAKEEYVDFDQVSQQVAVLAQDLRKITLALSESLASPEGKAAIKESLANLRTSTAQISDILQQNSQQFRSIMDNLKEFSSNLNHLLARNSGNISRMVNDLQEFSKTLREDGPVMAQQLQSVIEEFQGVLAENRDSLHEGISNANQLILKLQETADSLNSVLASVNKGEGTIGKLVKDDKLYDDVRGAVGGVQKVFTQAEAIRLYLGFRSEYLTRFEKSKSSISLRLQPAEDKYYLLELIDDFRGIKKTKETTVFVDGNHSVTTREEVVEDDFKISLQIAKRFQNITLRGGLIETTGGVGLDYSMMGGNLQLHLDAFDFGEEKPHLKIFAGYQLGTYISLSTGFDHLADEDQLSYFLGAGFSFEDRDLKYLLGKIPFPSL